MITKDINNLNENEKCQFKISDFCMSFWQQLNKMIIPVFILTAFWKCKVQKYRLIGTNSIYNLCNSYYWTNIGL